MFIKCINSSINETFYFYMSQFLSTMSQEYQPYHHTVALALLAVGMTLAAFNVIILNIKDMISPTTYILTRIGIMDLLTMIIYLPYVIYFYILNPCDIIAGIRQKAAAYFLFGNVILLIFSHCASIWLAIVLSAFRLKCLKSTSFDIGIAWRQVHLYTWIAVAITATFSIMNFFTTGVRVHHNLPFDTVYTVEVFNIHFIALQALVIKIVPSILLVVLVTVINMELKKFVRIRHSLGKQMESQHIQQTTKALIALALIFVTLELPQGILLLFSAISTRFFKQVYIPLGDLLDLITIIRTIANFFLYSIVDRRYRTVLMTILCPRQQQQQQQQQQRLRKSQKISRKMSQNTNICLSKRKCSAL